MMGKTTFAGSVIIIFLPGFFFGFDSVSDPDSMAPELADSKTMLSERYHAMSRLSRTDGN